MNIKSKQEKKCLIKLLRYFLKKTRKKIIKKNNLIIMLIAIILATSAACCFLQINHTKTKSVEKIKTRKDSVAKIETGKEILTSLAHGALHYSVQNGGNGKNNFPTNILDILPAIPNRIKKAIVFKQHGQEKAEPIDGYLARMSTKSTTNDFVFEAYPSEGFNGNILEIRKDSKITIVDYAPNNEKANIETTVSKKLIITKTNSQSKKQTSFENKTIAKLGKNTKKIYTTLINKIQKATKSDDKDPSIPPPPIIKDANPAIAKELLQSLYVAAEYYSVQNGGNGENKFPTNILDILPAIPNRIKKAIVVKQNEEEKAEPIEGYILMMLPSPSIIQSDNFCFLAYPAKNFKGSKFQIDKTGKITEINKERLKNETP